MSAVNRALVGAVAWSVFVFARGSELRGGAWTHALLLFAALVLVPLALELLSDAEEAAQPARWFKWLAVAQLPAALALTVACWLPSGRLAALATLPWVGVTGLMATIGCARLQREGLRRDLDGICRDVALVFALVGGAWILADRSGLLPRGFAPAIVVLTAVHFHYAGLLLPLFAGLVQRELFFWRFAARAAVGVVLGVPAVALGITVTQLGGGSTVESAASCGLALAGMAVAILKVRIALETRRALTLRVLLALSGAALFFAMVLALLFALHLSASVLPWLEISQLRMLHGAITAFGFGLCGVLAWRRMNERRVTRDETSAG